MPSKRRAPAKAPASAAHKATPTPSKDTLPTPPKATPAPPPPPPPVETPATKVRKEWQKFIVAWYEPEKKKLEEQLQKELTTKYKKSGSSKAQQKARTAELEKKLSNLAKQLAERARNEWERRLEAAQLRENQWDDMTSEEQQAVMNVFVGFFGDEDDDEDDDDAEDDQVASTNSLSLEADEGAIPDQPGGFTSLPRAKPSPLASANATFQFVNPTSLFVEGASQPHPATNLPSLSMDHLATLGTSHTGRPVDPSPMNASSSGAFSFHNWASEAGLTAHQTSKLASQTLGSRPSATDGISRQASAVSSISSPPLFSNKSSPPQSSPPIQSTKASPSAVNDALPLGKRYIGPVILDDDEPLDENLLKSKMAADYEEFKHSLRIQMIYDFHTEAADIEIKLLEMLLTNEGTKESRARAVQEHEMHMMALREQKEEERKRLCAQERERRREEHRAYLAQSALRSAQGRDVEPSSGRKGAPPKSSDKSAPPKGPTASPKEDMPVHPLTASASGSGPKLEPPSILKKSPSVLTEAEASSNEAIFAEAAAFLAKGRLATDGLVVSQPPEPRKGINSTRPLNREIPQITVNFADSPSIVPPAPAAKDKKAAKKAQAATSKPPVINEVSNRPDVDAEPPPPLSSWGASISRGVWGNPPTHASKGLDPDAGTNLFSTVASSLTAAWDTTKKPSSGKKSKTVSFPDDVGGESDAAPIAPCEPKLPKSTRSAVNGKNAKIVPVVEAQVPRGPVKVTPQSSNAKKPNKAPDASAASKRPKAAVVSEELEGVEEEDMSLSATPPSSQQARTKAAWGPTPAGQTKVATSQAGPQPLRGMEASRSKSARVETVPDPTDAWGMARGGGSANMPGALEVDVSEELDEDDNWLDKENADYWNKFIGVDTEKQPAATSFVSAEHVPWIPTADPHSDGDDDDDLGDDDGGLGGEIWMQYAISGGEIPGLDATIEPEVVSSQRRLELNVWEQGKMKKGGGSSDDAGKSSSMFDKTAFQGAPWPKMENWLSSSSRVGQSSGSARFL
ncbi:hypothetical protein F5J12DRAFT_842939 [Pisolithus orientalis]|uniref:uncharacterized protein n=1 Tax=Pisolithus orientalis TaxID=936130 RepID=UPI0022253B39|nr:uncharacterized protein F5J12DRAFT_842939 [Pisolithus orientalis]KAI6001556.1 hypothetical protein F5J12DRAFT_842939 [Pisolithus orientalis]